MLWGEFMFGENERGRLRVGYKQTLQALEDNSAERVFLSEDCDSRLRTSIENAAAAVNAEVLYVSTMRELGKMCGIDVKASCAAVIKC